MLLRYSKQGLLSLLLLPFAASAAQQISLSPANQQASPGEPFEVSLSYTADSEKLTGVGVQLYYDSSKLKLTGIHSIYQGGKLAVDSQSKPDTKNADGDATTDRFINAAWFDLSGNWPGTSTTPINLYTATFVATDFSGNSSIKLTGRPASRQNLQLGSTTVVGLGSGVGAGTGGSTGSGTDQPDNNGGSDADGGTPDSGSDNSTDGSDSTDDSSDNSGGETGSGDSAGDSNSTDDTTTTGSNGNSGEGDNNPADNNGTSGRSTQRLSLTPGKQEVAANQSFEVALKYSADSATLTGIGAQLYFDSSQLQLNEIRSVYASGKLAVDNQAKADAKNTDGIVATDKTINAAWFDLGGQWPGMSVNQPVTLYIARFTAVAGFTGESTITLSGRPASGQQVNITPAVITAKSGQTDSGTDNDGNSDGAGSENNNSGNQSSDNPSGDSDSGNGNTTASGEVQGDSGDSDNGRKKGGSFSWMMILLLGLFGIFKMLRIKQT